MEFYLSALFIYLHDHDSYLVVFNLVEPESKQHNLIFTQ
jgi:hypothetical protein